jgi:hypothetical protein
VTEEKLKAIEDMLSGESNYHHVMVTGEAVDAWSIDVGTLSELVAIARIAMQSGNNVFVHGDAMPTNPSRRIRGHMFDPATRTIVQFDYDPEVDQ